MNPHYSVGRVRSLPAAILLGLVAGTSLLAPAVMAQTTDNKDAAKTTDKAAADKAQTLGAISVTATGRAERIIAVPYNISAVSGESIEANHTLDNAELFRAIPGVNVIDSGPRNSGVVNSIRIRGINVDSSALGDYAVTSVAPVATYIDSVPLFANFLLFDIDRVEVLRGPQGTLYGSGSLGGTVRYILKKPELGRFNGMASASLSRVDDSGGIGNSESVMLNLPLGNTLALRVDGMRNDFPGVTDYVSLYQLDGNGHPAAADGILADAAEYTVKKDADTVKQNYGRVSMLWQPNDRFDVQLSYMAQADRYGARRGTSIGSDGHGVPYEHNQLGAAQLEPSNRHANLASLEANIDLGFATLTSSTSHYDHEGDITSDNTGFYGKNGWLGSFYYNYPRPMAKAVRGYSDEAFTQEVRLVSKASDRFDYIVGVYYHDQDTTASQDSYLVGFKDWWDAYLPDYAGAVIDDNDFHYVGTGKYRETAVYGQGTWHASDSLDITLGVRSFRDRYTATLDQHTGLYSSVWSSSTSSDTQKSSKTLFLGNLSWWFNPSTQLYATVSEGYRRGGANGTPTTGSFAEDPSWQFYKPDTVLNTELGFKGAGDNYTYTADVFRTTWKNPQLNTSTTAWGFFAVQNMGRAESKGVELELQGNLNDKLSYGLGYAYTDAKLTRDAWSADGVYLINKKGTRLPGVSRHRFNVASTYSTVLGSGLLSLRFDGSWQSASENSISANPKFAYNLSGFSLWNASASYSAGDWTASLWLKNLFNARGITGVYTEAYMGTSPAQNFFGNSSKLITTLPRTLGVTFSWRF
ncbi:MAG TPA: TonB-dependent receptor [Rhodanobacteraceae bacterium]|nr:TonB-dependent receptor [Rhodanobacteraceae bacterium]